MKLTRTAIALVFNLVVALCLTSAQAATLSASVDRTKIEDGDVIELTDLPFALRRQKCTTDAADVSPIREVQADAEKKAIVAALEQTGNNKVQAASLLGIHRTLLYKKMKKHGVSLSGRY